MWKDVTVNIYFLTKVNMQYTSCAMSLNFFTFISRTFWWFLYFFIHTVLVGLSVNGHKSVQDEVKDHGYMHDVLSIIPDISLYLSKKNYRIWFSSSLLIKNFRLQGGDGHPIGRVESLIPGLLAPNNTLCFSLAPLWA